MSNYIDNPHLMNGYKYDLKVFVFVTSINPLKVYIYDEGLVCLCSKKYTNNPDKLNQKCSHLTNNSVNWKNRTKRNLNWDFGKYRAECTKQGTNFE